MDLAGYIDIEISQLEFTLNQDQISVPKQKKIDFRTCRQSDMQYFKLENASPFAE